MRLQTNNRFCLWVLCLLVLFICSLVAEGDENENESEKRESLAKKIFSFFTKKNKVEEIHHLPALDVYGPDQYRYYLYNYPHQYNNGPYHQANLQDVYVGGHYQNPSYNDHNNVYQHAGPQYHLQEGHTGFQDHVHGGLHHQIQHEVEKQLYPLAFVYFNYGLNGLGHGGYLGKTDETINEENLLDVDTEDVEVVDESHELKTSKYDDIPLTTTDVDQELAEDTFEEKDVEDNSYRVARGFSHQVHGISDLKFDGFKREKKSRSISRKDNFAFSEHLRRGYAHNVFPEYVR